MEHDLIALHFGKKHGPILDLEIECMGTLLPIEGVPNKVQGMVRFYIQNSGKRVARYIRLILRFASKEHLQIENIRGQCRVIDHLYEELQAREYQDNIGVIHPELKVNPFDLKFIFDQADLTKLADGGILGWSLFADEMHKREGLILANQLSWAV